MLPQAERTLRTPGAGSVLSSRPTQKRDSEVLVALNPDTDWADPLFPWVDISLANLKRFPLGTHSHVHAKRLNRYFAEFNYRPNRRTAENDLLPRLLRACLGTQTIALRQLIRGV
jgi:hypothetical protein